MRKNNFQKNVLLIALLMVCLACVTVGCTMPPPNYGGKTTDDVTTDGAATDGETTDISEESDTEKITDDEVRPMQEVIDENLDIIVSDLEALREKVKAENNRYLTLRDCIDAHSKEFDTITAYGEAALPYLESIVAQDIKLYEWRSHMALCASYLIKPSLYHKVVPSPDQRFEVRYSISLDTWVWGLDLGSELYPYIELIELATGKTVTLYDGETCEIRVYWSSDSTYVAISHGYEKAVKKTFFYNTKDQTFVNLPSSDEIKSMLYGDKATLLEKFKITHSDFYKWENDHTVVIYLLYYVQFADDSSYDSEMKMYTYDLHKKEIINIEDFNLFFD